MKLISTISELKKGDTIIIKDCAGFESLGFKSVRGDIFNIEPGKLSFTIRCKETDSFEKISLEDGMIFLIG
jgi:hypothetical protein